MSSGELPSREMVEGPARAPARAMLHAAGFDDEALARPLVAIVHSFSTVTPCNMHLRDLAEHAAQGIEEAGGTPIEFNTIVVTDGIAMGTRGMRASLMSREVIADSAELAVRGHSLDAVVFIVGCDKTIPAAAMAAARLDLPSVILYGGSIMPGHLGPKALTIQDVFEAVGAHSAGGIGDDELKAVETHACPGAGACGGQFTANTMALAMSFLGLSPMGLNDIPAVHPRQAGGCGRSGTPGARGAACRAERPRPDHRREPAQRSRCGNRDGGVDQPRPPPARDRARSGNSRERVQYRPVRRSFPRDAGDR